MRKGHRLKAKGAEILTVRQRKKLMADLKKAAILRKLTHRCLNCSHARVKHRFTDLRGLTLAGSYYSGCYLCDCQEYQIPAKPYKKNL